jgi:transcriptional regulator with XRE-family HTH domain
MAKSILSKNIKKLRLFKGLNQTEFAALFGLTRSSIGAYEEARAEPKLDALIKISDYFKLSIDDIVKQELTVNKIAKFKLPLDEGDNFASLTDKIDSISLRLDMLHKKLNVQSKNSE